jgi:DNA (cytosine-5)-methyltransferase 1
MNNEKQLTFIDLFAGCGGLSLGAMKAGFIGKFAVEYQKNAFETLKSNLIDKTKSELLELGINGFDWPDNLSIANHDIKDFLKNKTDVINSLKDKIDIVIGGPPCQGFSNAGKRNEKDPRNQLYKSYLSFIKIINPKILIIENVAGIASKFSQEGTSYKDQIIKKLESKYHVDGKIISSEQFGVPQKRKRFIIIGISKKYFKNKDISLESIFTKISTDAIHFTQNYEFKGSIFNISNTSVYKALSDLDGEGMKEIPYEDDNAKMKSYTTFQYKTPTSDYQKLMRRGEGERNENNPHIDSHRIGAHNFDTVEKYKKLIEISKDKNRNRAGFGFSKDELDMANWNSKKQIINVLKSDQQSPTLTTCPFDYIHYNTPRILTVREFARIQSFPDWFEFKGIYATSGSFSYTTPRYTQIGNAVPPLMAESILKTLKSYLL